jgi:hypothetical protein
MRTAGVSIDRSADFSIVQTMVSFRAPLSNTSAIELANALCPAGPPGATPKTQTDRSHASVA